MTYEIPLGAAKTQVIILRSGRDFRRVTDDRGTGAFVVGLRGIPHIVMPAGAANEWSRIAIRHEYTPVLMGYSEHRFPPWYQEGFAEFMSGTEFRKKGTTFTFGDATGRYQSNAPLVPWGELMSGDFEFHSERTVAKISNAYWQSWLLVHYLTIGERFAHTDDLGMYLGHFSAGKSSELALDTVFAMTPQQLGDMVMRKYKRRTAYYELEFNPGIQDHEFVVTETDAEDVASTIADIHEIFVESRE